MTTYQIILSCILSATAITAVLIINGFKVKDEDKEPIKKRTMTIPTNIKNWLLPILLTIGGILDFSFDALTDVADEIGLDHKWVVACRVAAFVVSVIILKLQNPSKDPRKLQSRLHKAWDRTPPNHQ